MIGMGTSRSGIGKAWGEKNGQTMILEPRPMPWRQALLFGSRITGTILDGASKLPRAQRQFLN